MLFKGIKPPPTIKETILINPSERTASPIFLNRLEELLNELGKINSHLVILCIGSDRSTGDSLGPLVGSILKYLKPQNCSIWGTIEDPVHALNLVEANKTIQNKYNSPLILAVDAGLGHQKYIGCLELGKGGLLPGAGVQKKLPSIGDLFITGIVNEGRFMDFMLLQCTRLSTVIHLARFIGWGIFRATARVDWIIKGN